MLISCLKSLDGYLKKLGEKAISQLEELEGNRCIGDGPFALALNVIFVYSVAGLFSASTCWSPSTASFSLAELSGGDWSADVSPSVLMNSTRQ